MTPTTISNPPSRSFARKLGRLLRFIVFLATAGWAYPHVCTEDMDLTKLQEDQSRGVH